MFFCEECRQRADWPSSLMGSYGKCEICGNVRPCHDVRSSNLPDAKPQEEYVGRHRAEP